MAGAELPAWAIRLRQERVRRLWSQKDTAIRLRNAADEKTRAVLPGVESLRRYVRGYEAAQHLPGDLSAGHLACLMKMLFGVSLSAQTSRAIFLERTL